MDCKGCTKSFTPTFFGAHVAICTKIEDCGLSVKVMELIKVANNESTAHYEYKMLVNYSGMAWFVYKRFKQFF